MKTILCYGDSNTYGYDPRDFFGRPYNRIWTGVLDEYPEYHIINKGQPGRELPRTDLDFDILKAMLDAAGEIDLLLVMLGTNDLLTMLRIDLDEFTYRVETMADFLQQQNLQKICLISPPLIADGWTFPSNNRDCNEASKAMASVFQKAADSRGMDFLDAAQWNLPMSFDGVHLTEEGHILFARELMHYLEEVGE